MHQLTYIHIENFKVCQNVGLPLGQFTPLVGQNNTGKSSILQAIKWVLRPSAVSTSDFCDPSKPLSVSACIEGVDQEILALIPEAKHRTAIQPFCRNGHFWIRAIATGTTAKSITQEVWDVDSYSGTGIPTAWRSYPTGLPQAVSVLLPDPLYVEALDDLSEDLGKSKAGTTIKALLDAVMTPILAAHQDLSNAIETIRGILSLDGSNRSEHLKTFDKNATDALGSFFPGLSLDLDLQIVDIKEFFKTGDLHVTDELTGDRRRFDQIGTGAQRAVQMALIRYLAQTSVADPKVPSRRLLLIDEPELFLHPQGVRRLRQALKTLSESNFQVLFSTHSPLMLSRENAADTIVVYKKKGCGTATREPLRQAVKTALSESKSQSRTLFELGNLAEIYFSDLAILCEGKTDRRLLPLAYERYFGRSPELDNITFVSLGSCSDIPKALMVLAAMQIPSCAIADLDFAFTQARAGGLLPKDGQDLLNAKALLSRLQSTHGFALADNGLPANDKRNGSSAASSWATFAQDEAGKALAAAVHDSLLEKRIWLWTIGTIEDVTGHVQKGEEAIIKQESELQEMTTEDIDREMGSLAACLQWIKNCAAQQTA